MQSENIPALRHPNWPIFSAILFQLRDGRFTNALNWSSTRATESALRSEEAPVSKTPTDTELLDWLDIQRNFMVRRVWWGPGPPSVEASCFSLPTCHDEIYGETVREAFRLAWQDAHREQT
jgi:hypothetical protein